MTQFHALPLHKVLSPMDFSLRIGTTDSHVADAPDRAVRTLDPDKDLIEVPLVPRPWTAPTAYGLVGNRNPTLGQQQLHTPEAQTEDMVEPDGVADGLGREAMTVVWVGRSWSR
jgi:hypothetical protein